MMWMWPYTAELAPRGKRKKNSLPMSFNLALQPEVLNGGQLNAIIIFFLGLCWMIKDQGFLWGTRGIIKMLKEFPVLKRVFYNLCFSLELKPFVSSFKTLISHSSHPYKMNWSVAAIDDIKSQVHWKATSTIVRKLC